MKPSAIHRYIILGLFTTLISLPLAAEEPLKSWKDHISLISEEQAITLESEGEITQFSIEDFKPQIIPSGALATQLMDEIAQAELTLGIEALFLYKNIDMKDFESRGDEAYLELFNIFNKISTLKGIEYYSASRGEMRLLFSESYVIDTLQDKNPLPDTRAETLPEYNAFFIHQTDMSFGSNEYKIIQRTADGTMALSFINKTALWYGPIRIISPDKLHIHLLVIPVKEGLLFYGVCGAKTIKAKFLENKASKSFYNRIKALYNWFMSSVEDL